MTKVYALTSVQQGILFDIAMHRHCKGLYITQMLFEFKRGVESNPLRRAFDLLLARYPILGSALDPHGNGVVMHHGIAIPFHCHDYSSIKSKAIASKLKALLSCDLEHGFNLYQSPLMRVNVFHWGKSDTVVWTRHHILLDGRSVYLLVDELLSLYRALIYRKPTKPNQGMSCRFTLDCLSDSDDDKARTYWHKHLSANGAAYCLPRQKQSKQQGNGSELLTIEQAPLQAITHYCQQQQVTLGVLLQAAWSLILANYTQSPKVIFGFVRSYPRDIVGRTIGLFINTLPVCVNFDDFKYKKDLLDFLTDHAMKMKLYVDIPLKQIRKWGDIPLEKPLFNSIIDFKRYSLNDLSKEKYNDLHCNIHFNLATHYAVVMEVTLHKKMLSVRIQYDKRWYGSFYIEQILADYKTTLFSLIDDEQPLLDVMLKMNPVTYDLIVNQWNKTQRGFTINKPIHQFFEDMVNKHADAIALSCCDQHLSYVALNRQVNRLANYLLKTWHGYKQCIAIYLRPDFNVIISLLAVLKVGGFYCPLDPKYCAVRVKYLLEDCQPNIIITTSDLLNFLSQLDLSREVPMIALDTIDLSDSSYLSDRSPSLIVDSTNLAYVMYTSGTTGKPKGVLVEHRSIVNMALSCIEKLRVDSNSRILQIASFSFDVATAEWTMALLSGARLFLIDKTHFSPSLLTDALRDNKITTIILASSILASLSRVDLPHLKVIAIGGECCNKDTICYWAKQRTLINVYGITETTVCSTIAQFGQEVNVLNVGRPLPNTYVYILDDHQRPVPIGAPGEICIGGVSVARGYLNRPVLTSQQFITNHFITGHDDLSKRLYRTGDYGRWLESGEIEFLGRRDDQVKIRGHRVELSEIESTISAYPMVTGVCVIMHRVNTVKQLIAYVMTQDQQFSKSTLSIFLMDRLPSYMIPYRFIVIDRFPLADNGKTDKAKLAQLLENELLSINEAHVDKIAHGYHTKVVMESITSLTGFTKIALDKNFISLGLDSITLGKLAQLLSEKLGIEVPVMMLFTYTTVQSLSERLERLSKNLTADPNSSAESGGALKRKAISVISSLKRHARCSDHE